MDRWTLPFAVATALWAFGHSEPAKAPSPSAADTARLAALTPKPRRIQVSAANFTCLALNVYHEARGESPEGQLAVAYVTLNRVAEDGFPDTICGVVHQQASRAGPCQFGWTCANRSRRPTDAAAWAAARAVAQRALAGDADPTNGALYFQAAGHLPHWAAKPVGRMVIGHHEFFNLARRHRPDPGPETAEAD